MYVFYLLRYVEHEWYDVQAWAVSLYQLYLMQYIGLCIFSIAITLLMVMRICPFCLIVIIKSEVWTIIMIGIGCNNMIPTMFRLGNEFNPETFGNAWVRTQNSSYWWPAANAPDHWYSLCWSNMLCIRPVSYKKVKKKKMKSDELLY